MSRAATIDHIYRLQPVDLAAGPHTLTISAISVQGLEEMQPIAHFRETRKRLLLTQDHCRTLILLTGSTLFDDWIGYAISLRVDAIGPFGAIRILPPPERHATLRRLHYRLHNRYNVVRIHAQNLIQRLHAHLQHHPPATENTEHVDGPIPNPPVRSQVQWRPVLVIALLSVVSFFYARAYGTDLLQWIGALFNGNGG